MDQKREDKNICTHCSEWIDALQEISNLSSEDLDILDKPQKVLTFIVPLTMDDGSVKRFNGYRVQYNNALGPAKGGIRYHEDVDLEEVKTLSFLMTLKTSLVGLPLGGGKGGIEVNPKELSHSELERLTRSFVRQIASFIGPDVDIPAPDVNTTPEIMGWFTDEYSKIAGKPTPEIVTGKPVELGGSEGRDKATSLGGAFVLDALVKEKELEKNKLTVAIQGYGNVGRNIAEILDEWGYKIVAVSNSRGGIYNPDSLNIKEVSKSVDASGEFPKEINTKEITNEELLELPVDILIPAALSDQIKNSNVDKIKAKVIVEMANAPITHTADDILHEKSVIVIPDILANSGGVIVSYYEWLQNRSGEKWTEEDVNKKLKEQINGAFNNVSKTQKETVVSMRKAAYQFAVNRVLDAEKKRGWL